jgi:ribonuclease Z
LLAPSERLAKGVDIMRIRSFIRSWDRGWAATRIPMPTIVRARPPMLAP